jgi:uncharacterized membrane protein
MSDQKAPHRTCALCGRSFPPRELAPGGLVSESTADLIRQEHPDWSGEGDVCREDLARYRAQAMNALLAAERGELGEIEQEVLQSLHEHELLARDTDAEYQGEWSLGARLADRLAAVGGSWTFIFCFFGFIVLWMTLNSAWLARRPADPYPFILLNLVLSCLAAVQAPVIMMSQNRQEQKDRLRSQHDYQIDLKAELEVRHLHEKVDHLLSHQWERLMKIQELQIELLTELGRRK